MNYYPRFPAHYQTKTLHLTMEQDGAYSRLLDWYYANERPIPHASRYAVARAMTSSEKKSTDAVLREFFELQDDVWTQYRAEAEIAKARPKIDAAKENGKKGGRPSKKPPPPPAPPAEPPADETHGGADEKPNGFPVGSETGNPGGTQDEPGAKAPQSPISITTPEGLQRAQGSQSARATPPRPEPTPATQACVAMIDAGLRPDRVNASHPKLVEGIALGATPEDYRNTAVEALGKSPPCGFSWVIATVRDRLIDAAARAANPPPASAPGATNARPSPADSVAAARREYETQRQQRAETDGAIDAEFQAVE